jgi:hypothetical protein
MEHKKARSEKLFKKKWESKIIHGQYIKSTGRQLVSKEDILLLLSGRNVKRETESEIMATQDQALQTNITQQSYYRQKQRTNADYRNR